MSWNKRSTAAAPPGLPPYAQQGYNQPGSAAWSGTGTGAGVGAAYGHGYGAQFPPQPAYPPQYYGQASEPPANNNTQDAWEDNWDWGWDGQQPAHQNQYSQQQHSQHQHSQHQHSQHQHSQQQHSQQQNSQQQHSQQQNSQQQNLQQQLSQPPHSQQQHSQPQHSQQLNSQPQHSQQQYSQQQYAQQPQSLPPSAQFAQPQPPQYTQYAGQRQPQQPPSQTPLQHDNVYNNANIIEDSFGTNDTWNWNMGGAKTDRPDQQGLQSSTQSNQVATNSASEPSPAAPPATAPVPSTCPDLVPAPAPDPATLLPDPPTPSENEEPLTSEGGRSLPSEIGSTAEPVRLPLALGKRFHPDNLTPQWSIESQMSQDSSDGPLTHSEGTYRSDDLSRNSNKSSAEFLNVESSNYNYSQPEFDDFHHHGTDPQWVGQPPVGESAPTVAPVASPATEPSETELCASVQGLSMEPRPDGSHRAASPPLTASPHRAASPLEHAAAPPRGPTASPLSRTPPLAPPPTRAPSSTAPNPFKQAGPFSHKSAAKSFVGLPPGGFSSASRPPLAFGANLESAPDNSERPDGPAPSFVRPELPVPEEPDNLEVAPQPDRNSYLQTAHLSGDYCEPAPPPGLRHLVRGRGAGAEPPPGLARLVPGGPAVPTPLVPITRSERTPDGQPAAAPPAAAGQPREARAEGENLQDLPPAAPSPASVPPAVSRDDRTGSLRREKRRDRQRDREAEGRYSRSDRDDEGRYSRNNRDAESRYSRDERDVEERYSRGERDADGRGGRDERERDDRETDGSYVRGDDSRYSRGERSLYTRGERRDHRGERGSRRRVERDDSEEERRARRPPRPRRYDTEDTDYASDRDRDRDTAHRRAREGSAWEGGRRRRDDERRRRHYRDIDPARRHRRTVVTFATDAGAGACAARDEGYSPGRDATDEDGAGGVGGAGTGRRERRSRRHDPRHLSYVPDYSGYGAGVGVAAGVAGGVAAGVGGGAVGGAAVLTREQYEYYARLRVTDPHAYLQLYRRLAAATSAAAAADVYSGFSYDGRIEDRGSVHSGRSSANGLKGNETCGFLRRAPSLPRALSVADSDRELTTDVSLALAESSARSDRFTPLHFATHHVKGTMCGAQLVVACGSRVSLLPLATLLRGGEPRPPSPPPPEHGVTHKKSVLDYTLGRAAGVRRERARGVGSGAAGGGLRDAAGQALTWDYLALLLRQNGVVVGSDIAELLIKNVQEFDYESAYGEMPSSGDGSRRGSSSTGREPSAEPAADSAIPQAAICIPLEEGEAGVRLRELLLYGNRSEALECAMEAQLWGHALALAGAAGAAQAVLARFVRSLPPRDAARTLHAARLPPRAAAVWTAAAGDWRPHAAILLANGEACGQHAPRLLLAMADWLAQRRLPHSAQLCALWAGHDFSPPPRAPWSAPAAPAGPAPAGPAPRAPRLWLLLGEGDGDARSVSSSAIRATAIYEYAAKRTLPSLQVYKALMAFRALDAGLEQRAVAWARAAHAQYLPPRCARALQRLAERLVPPDETEEAGEGVGVAGAAGAGGAGGDADPARRWLAQLQQAAEGTCAGAAPDGHPLTTQAQHDATWQPQPQAESTHMYNPETFSSPQSYQPEEEYLSPQPVQEYQQSAPTDNYQHNHEEQKYNEWPANNEVYDNYWTGDYTGYGEGGAARPTITMPGHSTLADETDHMQNHQQDLQPPEPSSTAAPAKDAGGAADQGGAGGAGGAPGGAAGAGKPKSGWLGGILTKLSLRPPNQMILPDDKNPSIVWDEQQKRWRDVAGGDSDVTAPPPPPPVAPPPARALPPIGASTPLASPALAAPQANIFKMQKSRHIKKSYVDVLGGTRASAPAPASLLPPPPAPPAMPDNYFVPADAAILFLPSSTPVPGSPLPSPVASSTQLSEVGNDDQDLYQSGI